jgi:plasmid stabilization system protein ParE
MEIKWSAAALQRVCDIGTFIASDSPARAGQFVDQLLASVGRLSKFPYSGPLTPENPAFRQIVFQKYRLIYRVTAKGVEVVTVISPGKP